MKMRVDISGVLKGMAEHQIKVQKGVELYARTSAKKLEKEAKNKAPWTDRTGLARSTITGDAEMRGNKAVISLSGNMDYSIFLEEARGGKYAVLKPTIDSNEQEILEGLSIILER